MFLDPGIIVGPRWWESLVRTLDKDPRVAAVAGKIILPDGRIDHAGLALLEWWDQPDRRAESFPAYGRRLTGRSILAGKPAESSASNQLLRVQALAGEGIMVRANAFFSVGGFSARLGRDHHHDQGRVRRRTARAWICACGWAAGAGIVSTAYESVMTRLRSRLAADGPAAVPGLLPSARTRSSTAPGWAGRAAISASSPSKERFLPTRTSSIATSNR